MSTPIVIGGHLAIEPGFGGGPLWTEWAPFGIRVNALAPGYMVTPPVIALRKEDPDRWEHWMARVPMGRAGDPDDLQVAL